MARKLGEVGKRRREEIVDAAVAVIAAEGLPSLSLSAIEQRAKMSRGQLTYYFKTKEDILLAVFDRMIDSMHRREKAGEGCPGMKLPGAGWERLRAFLGFFLTQPVGVPEFHALQYTFLSQIGHRDDFRRRLAALYEGWRGHVADDVKGEMPDARRARTFATLFQALLHGLAMQREADPAAFDPADVLALCDELIGGYFARPKPGRRRKPKAGDV